MTQPLPGEDAPDLDIDYTEPAVMPDDHTAALERASWHMRIAAMLTAERDQLTAVYLAEMDRLVVRLQHRQRILNERIAWHEEPVKSLHLALLRIDPRRKTIELPHGASKIQVPKTPKAHITDKGALLAWAEDHHPDLLSRDINVTAVRTIALADATPTPEHPTGAVDANGEVIPGVEVRLDPPKWSATYEHGEELE